MSQAPLPPELSSGIAHNVEHLWSGMLKEAGVAPGAWEDGVHFLESVILQSRDQMSPEVAETTADLIGSFLGQAMVALHGGQWVQTDKGPAVDFGGGTLAFPFSRTEKLIADGADQSLLALLQTIPRVIAQGGG